MTEGLCEREHADILSERKKKKKLVDILKVRWKKKRSRKTMKFRGYRTIYSLSLTKDYIKKATSEKEKKKIY